MRVDHLSCAAMHPPFLPALPAHVLLCHTDDGLVLVDAGLGTRDHAEPARRLGPIRHLLRAELDDRHSALEQVRAAGLDPEDVRHVVLTHLDLDHVGGIADFPHAEIHTTADEHAAAVSDPTWRDRRRYRPAQLDHDPVFRTHAGRGDRWRFDLTGHEVLPGIVLVPMPGHSRGHAAVAVDAGERGILLHAGDAVFDASSVATVSPSGRPLTRLAALRAFERVVGVDGRAIRANHETLTRLGAEPGVTVIPAHDPRVMTDLQAVSSA